ncbi:MAG: hypothetical protein UY76_C0045G0015 [Candidatus Uhrbacteria bacterium GW2011_GWA2_52_8d]|uniref:Uncharacterized protein n=1 Tax=Candidatus Uhrbacteria bacterium GW2011_GWA2_52_8d TaxID=1618979 RepID=A0A0G1XMC0_9BACT|nr:MAG: hypothetical protein UY76_C0045G0015 [Candidatus Uhrbacteria bacterium GW2011_GWA2_52_8d]
MIDLNPNLPPPPAQAPYKSPALIGVVLLICVAAFFGGVLVTNLWEGVRDEQDDETEKVSQIIEEETDEVVDDEETNDAEVVSTDSELVIDWIDPYKQPSVTVNSVLYSALCPDYSEPDSEKPWNACGTPPQITQVRLGTVVGGTYDGRYLEMLTVRFEELGYSYRSVYILVDPTEADGPVLLDQEAQTIGQAYPAMSSVSATEILGWSGVTSDGLSGFSIDMTATIPALTSQTDLVDTEGNTLLFTGKWVRFDTDIASSPLEATTTIQLPDGIAEGDGGELVLYEAGENASTRVGDNQYYLIDEDGRMLWYDLEVPFFTYQVDGEGNRMISQGVPSIVWTDGSVNTQTYMKGALGGCGVTTATNAISDETIETFELEQAGTAQGIIVYEPSSFDSDYFADVFNAITFTYPDEEPKSYSDFEHPYVYFQDTLGRWVELSSIEVIPPVECGKPVIYLYPESTMDMRVWVSPRGGFTYTEPDYGDGWDVTAYPDGKLVNRADGLEYPYLFWEGRGGMYSPVETYWVVERAGVESFLRETLAKMNFNQSEIADFIEFWLPRMQSGPFYKIGFHGTNVMNELAPLSLSVKPDHIFRILMDYEGLDVWQPSKPPVRLPRANRDGFEVMEWGGVLR